MYLKGKNQKSNCRRWDRKSFKSNPNYSTALKEKKNCLNIGLLGFGSKERVGSVCTTNDKFSNWPIEMKLNWPSRPWDQMWLRPNLTPSPGHPLCALSALTAAVVPGGGSEEPVSPDGSLEGDGLESPLWPLFVAVSGQHPPPPPPPPSPGVLSLLVWPLKWPLNTVRVSHVCLVWHWTAERICKSNPDVRFWISSGQGKWCV